MGLSITLRRPKYVNPDDEIVSRLNIAYHVLEFHKPYFKPATIEIWQNAPLESLEGTLANTLPVSENASVDFQYMKQYLAGYHSWDEKLRLIFKFSGEWRIGEVRTDGYVTVYNPITWRNIYGDIESNIYPSERFPDLVNLLKSDQSVEKRLVNEFLEAFTKKVEQEILKVTTIYLGAGVPTHDVTTLIAAYYGTEEAFILDCLRTLLEGEDSSVKDSFTPYKERFLIKSLREIQAFRMFLEELFVKYNIERGTAGSISLVGHKLESFKLFYEDFSAKILRPVAAGLPKEQEIVGIIKDAVEGKGVKQVKLG